MKPRYVVMNLHGKRYVFDRYSRLLIDPDNERELLLYSNKRRKYIRSRFRERDQKEQEQIEYKLVPVRIRADIIEQIDKLVRSGAYDNRSDFIRKAIEQLLRIQRTQLKMRKKMMIA